MGKDLSFSIFFKTKVPHLNLIGLALVIGRLLNQSLCQELCSHWPGLDHMPQARRCWGISFTQSICSENGGWWFSKGKLGCCYQKKGEQLLGRQKPWSPLHLSAMCSCSHLVRRWLRAWRAPFPVSEADLLVGSGVCAGS